MSRDEVRKLLGGYATGTLTQAEQEALFAAALEDQELFEALAKEQPVRDLLRDPAARAELLAALDGGEKRAWWPWPRWWQWRPLIAGIAMAGIAAVAVVAWRGSPASKPAPVLIAELKREEAPPASTAARRLAEDRGAQQAAAPTAPAKQQGAVEQEKKERDVIPPRESLKDSFAAPPAPPANAPPPPITAEAPPIAPVKPGELVQPSPALPFQERSNASSVGVVGGVVAGSGGRQFGSQRAKAAPPAASQAPQQGQQGQQSQMALSVNLSADVALRADKKAAAAVQCTILRGANEVALGTPLDAGETVRLRIVPAESGRVVVLEGGKAVASAEVEKSKPFDTPPLPFSGSGMRDLRVLFVRAGSAEPPVVLPVTITYR